MLKDGFWHDYLGEGDTYCWRMYKWDETRQCFIFRNKPQY